MLVYDTINGIGEGYDNFVMVPMFIPQYVPDVLTSAQVTMFNMHVNPGDEGGYYCNFITGSGLNQGTNDSKASSSVFNLLINTLTSNKSGRTANNWKTKYPILIASAVKILL